MKNANQSTGQAARRKQHYSPLIGILSRQKSRQSNKATGRSSNNSNSQNSHQVMTTAIPTSGYPLQPQQQSTAGHKDGSLMHESMSLLSQQRNKFLSRHNNNNQQLNQNNVIPQQQQYVYTRKAEIGPLKSKIQLGQNFRDLNDYGQGADQDIIPQQQQQPYQSGENDYGLCRSSSQQQPLLTQPQQQKLFTSSHHQQQQQLQKQQAVSTSAFEMQHVAQQKVQNKNTPLIRIPEQHPGFSHSSQKINNSNHKAVSATVQQSRVNTANNNTLQQTASPAAAADATVSVIQVQSGDNTNNDQFATITDTVTPPKNNRQSQQLKKKSKKKLQSKHHVAKEATSGGATVVYHEDSAATINRDNSNTEINIHNAAAADDSSSRLQQRTLTDSSELTMKKHSQKKQQLKLGGPAGVTHQYHQEAASNTLMLSSTSGLQPSQSYTNQDIDDEKNNYYYENQKRFKTLQSAQSQPRRIIQKKQTYERQNLSLQQRRKKTKMLFTNSYMPSSSNYYNNTGKIQQNLYLGGAGYQASTSMPSQTVQYQTSTLSTPDRSLQHKQVFMWQQQNNQQPQGGNSVLQKIKNEVHLRKEKSRQRERLLRQIATDFAADTEDDNDAVEFQGSTPPDQIRSYNKRAYNNDQSTITSRLHNQNYHRTHYQQQDGADFSSEEEDSSCLYGQELERMGYTNNNIAIVTEEEILAGSGVPHHGKSQSSFRSYTNHHMGSGSNHFVTDEEELCDNGVDLDCETCLDRQQESTITPRRCQDEFHQYNNHRNKKSTIVNQSPRKDPRNLGEGGNGPKAPSQTLSIEHRELKDYSKVPLLTEPCIQDSTIRDKKRNKNGHKNYQPSDEQILLGQQQLFQTNQYNQNHGHGHQYLVSSLRSFAQTGGPLLQQNQPNRTLDQSQHHQNLQEESSPNTNNNLHQTQQTVQQTQTNYQTNASTMHFATSTHQAGHQYFHYGTGTRPTNTTQQQVLQSTGEFIVPDLSGEGEKQQIKQPLAKQQPPLNTKQQNSKLQKKKLPRKRIQQSPPPRGDKLQKQINDSSEQLTQSPEFDDIEGLQQQNLMPDENHHLQLDDRYNQNSNRPSNRGDEIGLAGDKSIIHNKRLRISLRPDDTSLELTSSNIQHPQLQPQLQTQKNSPLYRQQKSRLLVDAITTPVSTSALSKLHHLNNMNSSRDSNKNNVMMIKINTNNNSSSIAHKQPFPTSKNNQRPSRNNQLNNDSQASSSNFPLHGLITPAVVEGRNARTTQQSPSLASAYRKIAIKKHYQNVKAPGSQTTESQAASSSFPQLQQFNLKQIQFNTDIQHQQLNVGPASGARTPTSNLLLKKQHLQLFGKQKSTYASRQKDFSASAGSHMYRQTDDDDDSYFMKSNQQAAAVQQASDGYNLCCANFCVQKGSNHQIIIENTANSRFVVEAPVVDRRDRSLPNNHSYQEGSRQITEMTLSSPQQKQIQSINRSKSHRPQKLETYPYIKMESSTKQKPIVPFSSSTIKEEQPIHVSSIRDEFRATRPRGEYRPLPKRNIFVNYGFAKGQAVIDSTSIKFQCNSVMDPPQTSSNAASRRSPFEQIRAEEASALAMVTQKSSANTNHLKKKSSSASRLLCCFTQKSSQETPWMSRASSSQYSEQHKYIRPSRVKSENSRAGAYQINQDGDGSKSLYEQEKQSQHPLKDKNNAAARPSNCLLQ